MNLYQYCLNNPVNWIDPYGLNVFGGFVSWIAGSGWDNSVNMGWSQAGQLGKGFAQGAAAGAVIAADAYTFGMIDPLNNLASEKVSEYGTAGRASRIAAGISRDALIAAVGIKGTAAVQKALASRKTVTVARWGREGLKRGDWVMRGGKNSWNYLMSGKYQPIANQFASYGSGATYTVSGSALQAPGGFWGAAKTAVGQFIFSP